MKKIFIGLLIVLLVFLIFMVLPIKPLKSKFKRDVKSLLDATEELEGVYTEEDFVAFPKAIQEFVKRNGYIGKKKAKYMSLCFKNVDFYQTKERKLKIDYTQYNFASKITRLAFIDTSFLGLPFYGYDFLDGREAFMKGVIAKCFPIFTERGKPLVKGNLVTYLAETIFNPSAMLNSGAVFTEVDAYTVLASLNESDITISGTFYFNDNYEMTKFVCNNRGMLENGKSRDLKWTAKCGEYAKNSKGINFPTNLQAIWNYPEGDLVYFDGKIDSVVFGN
ncbi:MAG: hypothetical protein P1P64_04410 [Treponemataceae bacterium]